MGVKCPTPKLSAEEISRDYSKQTLIELQSMDISNMEPNEAVKQAQSQALTKVIGKLTQDVKEMINCLDTNSRLTKISQKTI